MATVVSCSCLRTGLALAIKDASEGIGGKGASGVSCRLDGAALASAAIRDMKRQLFARSQTTQEIFRETDPRTPA